MSTGQATIKGVHSVAAVATSTTEVLAADSERRWALFQNVSDTEVCLKMGVAAVAGQGICIAPGGNYEMSERLANLDLRAVNGIHAGTGTKNINVTEG